MTYEVQLNGTQISFFTACLGLTVALTVGQAQPQPPPPAPAPTAAIGPHAPAVLGPQATYSRRGVIKAFNSGPDGAINGLILRDGTVVLFPAESGRQLRLIAKEGSRVTITGFARPGAADHIVVDAQAISAGGQTFTMPIPSPARAGAQPGPPPPPLSSGRPAPVRRAALPRPDPPQPPAPPLP